MVVALNLQTLIEQIVVIHELRERKGRRIDDIKKIMLIMMILIVVLEQTVLHVT